MNVRTPSRPVSFAAVAGLGLAAVLGVHPRDAERVSVTPVRSSTSEGSSSDALVPAGVLGSLRAPIVVQSLDAPSVASTAPVALRRAPGTLPLSAALAYEFASDTVRLAAPGCDVPATALAAIGRLASDHGRRDTAGRTAVVADTDGGELDGDPKGDRFIGPMGMLPAMWSAAAVDADGDGTRDPEDLDDAALAAAVYLCATQTRGDDHLTLARALRSWSADPAFAPAVLRLSAAYAAPAFAPVWSHRASPMSAATFEGSAIPVSPARATHLDESAPTREVGTTTDGPGSHGPGTTARPTPAGSPRPTPTPDGSGPAGGGVTPAPSDEPSTPTPTDPTPTDPTPTDPATEPTHSPDPAGLFTVSGWLDVDHGVWSVSGTVMDIGSDAVQARQAGTDLDHDGVVESNLDELTGLLGSEVEVVLDGDNRLQSVDGAAYPG